MCHSHRETQINRVFSINTWTNARKPRKTTDFTDDTDEPGEWAAALAAICGIGEICGALFSNKRLAAIPPLPLGERDAGEGAIWANALPSNQPLSTKGR